MPDYAIGIFAAAMTKSAIKKAIKKQWVTVDDEVGSTATFVNGGECIKLTIPPHNNAKKELGLFLKVLYEDEHLAVIQKPAGILVSGNKFRTIANALSQNLKPSTLVDAAQPQPVHRLDFATTGVLLIGKTSSSIIALNNLFVIKEIEKTYYAATIGNMNIEGTITTEVDNKSAVSKYKVIESVDSIRFGQLNLVKLQPVTGRRHQLRKHFSSIGHPILGDKDYGLEGLVLKGKGMYLHAHALKFIHPFTKEVMLVEDALPMRFAKIFNNL